MTYYADVGANLSGFEISEDNSVVLQQIKCVRRAAKGLKEGLKGVQVCSVFWVRILFAIFFHCFRTILIVF